MAKPKLLVSFKELPQEVIDLLSKEFEMKIIDKSIGKATKQDFIDNIPGMFGLLCSFTVIDEDVLNAAGPSLKVISTTSMGYDGIDTNALKNRNILLGNAIFGTTQRVAELAVGLLIATSKNFFTVNKQIKTGELPKSLGTGIMNSVVGIIGCGNIGIAVAQMLSGFKMSNLLYTSRRTKPEMERLGGQLVAVDDLVKQSDFIILTVVLVPETKFIINRDRLNLMKPNAVIINVGRGQLIDQDALVDALRAKRIRGAGLDVMTPEPLPLDSPLITMENVVLLPHIGGRNTVEALLEKTQVAANNILAVLNDKPMPYQVNL